MIQLFRTFSSCNTAPQNPYSNSRLSGCVKFKHPLPLSDKLHLASRPRRKVLKTMATATVPKVENPKNDITQTGAPNSTPSTTEDPHSSATTTVSPTHGGGGVDKPREKPTKNTDCSTEVAVTDIQKKMKRAERFGMPVQLSEQEKRNSRAERFGIGSATHGSETSRQPEELKMKARAERFGIVQSAPADEEARKKARLARFGSVNKVDSAEDDKKKARAIRFSQPHSGPPSVANDNGNTKFKTAIAGKAGGGT